LPEFLKRLEDQGIKLTQEMRASQFSSKMRVAFITDPVGTKIELTEVSRRSLQPIDQVDSFHRW
jgi:hypothetical protein